MVCIALPRFSTLALACFRFESRDAKAASALFRASIRMEILVSLLATFVLLGAELFSLRVQYYLFTNEPHKKDGLGKVLVVSPAETLADHDGLHFVRKAAQAVAAYGPLY